MSKKYKHQCVQASATADKQMAASHTQRFILQELGDYLLGKIERSDKIQSTAPELNLAAVRSARYLLCFIAEDRAIVKLHGRSMLSFDAIATNCLTVMGLGAKAIRFVKIFKQWEVVFWLRWRSLLLVIEILHQVLTQCT